MGLKDIDDCPFCESHLVTLICKPTSLNYKGNLYEVKGYYYQCLICGEKFTTNESDEETLNQIPDYGNK